LNACLDFTPAKWLGYIGGYRKAAEALIAHVEQTLRDQDYLIFPVMFLWRQHLELQLKFIIYEGQGAFQVSGPRRNTHNLRNLWDEARSLIEKHPSSNTLDLSDVESTITELDAIDPGSDGFRYPVDVKGNPTLTGAPQRINLRNAHDVLGRLSNLLSCVASELSHVNGYRLEYERERRLEAQIEYAREMQLDRDYCG
jgi:hypothetical protein